METLREVDEGLALRIWRTLSISELDEFSDYAKFSEVLGGGKLFKSLGFPSHDSRSVDRYVSLRRDSAGFLDFCHVLQEPFYLRLERLLVCLDISTISVRESFLYHAIADLPSLAMLVFGPKSGVSEAAVSSWVRAAVEAHKLQRLKVLVVLDLWNGCDLAPLASIPSLQFMYKYGLLAAPWKRDSERDHQWLATHPEPDEGWPSMYKKLFDHDWSMVHYTTRLGLAQLYDAVPGPTCYRKSSGQRKPTLPSSSNNHNGPRKRAVGLTKASLAQVMPPPLKRTKRHE
jgi:hypothetical protein